MCFFLRIPYLFVFLYFLSFLSPVDLSEFDSQLFSFTHLPLGCISESGDPQMHTCTKVLEPHFCRGLLLLFPHTTQRLRLHSAPVRYKCK